MIKGWSDDKNNGTSCGSSCGASNPEPKTSSCGSACGAGDNK